MNLKRLWDTENKKTVRAIPTWDPHKKFQVWTNDDGSKLYVYANSKYEELNTANAAVSEYWPTVWKTLDGETVGYYLTNEPTDLYNRGEGDDVTVTFVSDPADSGYVMGYERDEEQEDDVETVITSAVFPSWINLSVVVWQDTSIQFDDLVEVRHTEYFPVPNGSNTFAWVFIGETEVTDQAIELTQDTTLTVKFNEDSR